MSTLAPLPHAERAADCGGDHRPYAHGESMPVRVVRNVLDAHGVASRITSDGLVLAWEASTTRTVKGVVDSSQWVVINPDACTLATWLGY